MTRQLVSGGPQKELALEGLRKHNRPGNPARQRAVAFFLASAYIEDRKGRIIHSKKLNELPAEQVGQSDAGEEQVDGTAMLRAETHGLGSRRGFHDPVVATKRVYQLPAQNPVAFRHEDNSMASGPDR